MNGPFITLTTHGGGWLADRFELVEAVGTTAPAAPAVETYSVCIKAHCVWSVGEVVAGSLVSRPECWLPCDKDGWVTHDPQPDSVCPVPVSVSKFEAQRRDGSLETTTDAASWQLGSPGDRTPNKYDIVAWRPVKS